MENINVIIGEKPYPIRYETNEEKTHIRIVVHVDDDKLAVETAKEFNFGVAETGVKGSVQILNTQAIARDKVKLSKIEKAVFDDYVKKNVPPAVY